MIEVKCSNDRTKEINRTNFSVAKSQAISRGESIGIRVREFNGFADPESGAVNAFAAGEVDTKGFEHACVPIGSGVSVSVLPAEGCQEVPLKEAKKPKAGYAYEGAGGHRIVNEGQRDITCISQEGALGRMGLQAAEVNKTLGSTARGLRTQGSLRVQRSAHRERTGM